MVKFASFDPPGNNPDFVGNAQLAQAWSTHMSNVFDIGVASVSAYLARHGGGTCQIYNPLTHGRADADLPADATDIPWSGFPKRHGSPDPTQPPDYAGAEMPIARGETRDQDEYLEWFVNRENGKIASIHFTCEAYDYFQFLGDNAPDTVLGLYKNLISQQVQMGDLFPNGPQGSYDRLNKWNTEFGALHLTNGANNLFAEVFLAASATVRRSQHGAELTQTQPLIQCSKYGEPTRNSDPAIGAAVNGLARAGRHVTIANPVGLYMASFDGTGLTINGAPAGGFFQLVRGAFPLGLRAVYALPPELVAQGLTVSDVKIGATPLQYGGQLAERITMHIAGLASVVKDVNNAPISTCGAVPQLKLPAHAANPFAAGLEMASRLPSDH
jgi:hypothetical protein